MKTATTTIIIIIIMEESIPVMRLVLMKRELMTMPSAPTKEYGVRLQTQQYQDQEVEEKIQTRQKAQHPMSKMKHLM
jgi:hypothetical protein